MTTTIRVKDKSKYIVLFLSGKQKINIKPQENRDLTIDRVEITKKGKFKTPGGKTPGGNKNISKQCKT